MGYSVLMIASAVWAALITYFVTGADNKANNIGDELLYLRRDHNLLHDMCSKRHEVLVGVNNEFYKKFIMNDEMSIHEVEQHVKLKAEVDFIHEQCVSLRKEMSMLNEKLFKKRPLFEGIIKVDNYTAATNLGKKQQTKGKKNVRT